MTARSRPNAVAGSRRTLAAAQIRCRPGDVLANLAAHARAIGEARERGVDLLVFPELSLTDYQSHPDAAGLARRPDGPELAALAALAPAMAVVVGFIEQDPAGGRPFNSAALLQGGAVAHVHRKLNLPTYGGLVEGLHYRPGRALDTVSTPAGRTACLVCADAWNPALPWLAALGGAEVAALPVASARGAVGGGFDPCENWRLTLRHLAMTYGLPLVMANHCGRRGGLDFWGGSAILDASGRVVAEAGETPELVVGTIDRDDTATARRLLPTVRDADPVLVAQLLARALAAGPPARSTEAA